MARDLSIMHLAPGGHAGRLTVWSRSALSNLSKRLMEVGERFAASTRLGSVEAVKMVQVE